ncbi:MAG: galactokinase family protein [Candidatus Hodarchaeota archaeon]
MKIKELSFKAPARVVLFGEHQDYLGLPVIPAAVDLYMVIKGKLNNLNQYQVDLPDLKTSQRFSASQIAFQSGREYLQSGVKVLQEEGIIPKNKGVSARITSQIPMQAGLSSSSALNVIWIAFLAKIFGTSLAPMEITKLAHRSEVLEFNEPGGMQDHMAIAHGFVNFEEFDPIKCTRLKVDLPGIVVGNSLERKDTLNTLSTIRNGVERGLKFMGVSRVKKLTLEDIQIIDHHDNELDQFSLNVLKGAVTNFELTKLGYNELKKPISSIDEEYIGRLMSKHHASLRDYLDVSTPKIEKMIDAAMHAGAFGCKVTGSGNGGCMIAYCPGHEDEVSKAIEGVGAQTHIAKIVSGVSQIKSA